MQYVLYAASVLWELRESGGSALVPLVIFTAEHMYSGNPGDRFSAQGAISHNKLVIYK